MSEKKNLLGELKIERDALPDDGGLPWRGLLIGLALLLTIAAAWALIGGEDPIEVRTAAVERSGGGASAGSVLDASGYVIARRQATVSSKLTGKVTEVLIEEGMRVSEGQVLARIDDSIPRAQLALAQSQFDAAEASLDEVQARLTEARQQHRRNRQLAQEKLVSQSVLDNSRATLATLDARLQRAERDVTVAQRNVELQQQQVDDTIVRAPFDGIVTVKAAQPGEMISPISAGGGFTRTGIGTVVDMESLEIEVDVNENFINRVQAGQPAEARLNAYPDWAIPARVIAIVPTADRQKATVRVRVQIEARDERILPEMGVRVAFLEDAPTTDAAPILRVPLSALGRDSDGEHVFVIRSDTAYRRAVRTGARANGRVEVLEGLSGGETVAVSNRESLDDGAAVTISP